MVVVDSGTYSYLDDLHIFFNLAPLLSCSHLKHFTDGHTFPVPHNYTRNYLCRYLFRVCILEVPIYHAEH